MTNAIKVAFLSLRFGPKNLIISYTKTPHNTAETAFVDRRTDVEQASEKD
jgi:galactokinase